ncbi:MAG: hypothetical protein JXR65_04635 [Bacteroidales bacterium]|nr:hypothetical protein [Bacteroidales bacterium]
MNEIIQNQDQELQRVIYQIPALITLYAISHRGEKHLDPKEEKSAAIYLTVICNQGPEKFKDFFKEVKKTFKKDLHELNEELPGETENRKAEIEKRLLPVKTFLKDLPETHEVPFKDALFGFATHTRSVVGDTLESVMLPFISDNLRKIEDERLHRIL